MHTRHPLSKAIFALALLLPTVVFAGGVPQPLELSLGLGMAARSLTFSPTEPKPYRLNISPSINGYTDDTNPNNRAEVFSANGHFTGTEDATGVITNTSSTFATVAQLRAALADPNGWTLRVTDGATATVYTFHFHVNAANLADEFLRPIIFTNVLPGDLIGNFPTFRWTQATTANPDAQYVNALNQLYSGDFANIYTSPGINVTDTSWTPTGPIARNPSGYTVFVATTNDFPRQDLITVSFDPVGPPDVTLDFFGPYISTAAFAYIPFLTVPCTGDLNGDNIVNVADLTKFLGQFGKNCPQITGICADFNNDGVVNVSDLTTFLGRFGNPC
jgi:hypothetical protein